MAIKSLKEMQQTAIDTSNGETVNPKELLKVELLSSFEKYTRVMFKAQYHRSFIVAEHHKRMFEALQNVVDGKCKRLIINIAPRYGKTELVIKSFISWCFALNPKCRFLHLSYSDILVNDNSELWDNGTDVTVQSIVTTNAVGSLTLSASGTTLSITDGTNTWTLSN